MVEATNTSQRFDNVLKTFTDKHKSWFDELKINLPLEQMKMAEERIPEMLALKAKLQELVE